MQADKLDIIFEEIPLSWHPENPMVAYFLNSLSLTIPAGEAVFMNALDHAARNTSNANLKRDIKVFIQQESNHSKSHSQYNAWLQKNYAFLDGYKGKLQGILKFFILRGHRHRLACTVALEFLTYAFARITLKDGLLKKANPELARFWTWHSVEEIDHKSIAFRSFDELKMSYPRQIFAMFTVVPPLVFLLSYGIFNFAKEDRLLNLRMLKAGLRFFITKEKFLPKMLGYLLLYFIPLFRPEHVSDEGLTPDQAKKEEIAKGQQTPTEQPLKLVS